MDQKESLVEHVAERRKHGAGVGAKQGSGREQAPGGNSYDKNHQAAHGALDQPVVGHAAPQKAAEASLKPSAYVRLPRMRRIEWRFGINIAAREPVTALAGWNQFRRHR